MKRGSLSRFEASFNLTSDGIDISELIYSIPKFQKSAILYTNFKHENFVYLNLNYPNILHVFPKTLADPEEEIEQLVEEKDADNTRKVLCKSLVQQL